MSDPNAPAPQQPQGPWPAAGPPRGQDGWFSQATSTAGGRIAVVAAALFGTLLLVAGVGLAAALVAGVGPGRGDDERVAMSERDGPGNGRGMGLGNGQDKGMGQGKGSQGNRPGNAPGNQGNGQGNNGNGPVAGRLGAGMDDVLHGEFTTNVTGTPTVMVMQSGQVTAYSAGTSLTVRSADGFEATYVLDATVATMRGAAELATGVPVQVVAAKEGMKVTRLSVG